MVLIRSLLGGSHFDVGSVVASPHGAAVFHDAIQAIKDTLTCCKVLAGEKKKINGIGFKMVNLLKT